MKLDDPIIAVDYQELEKINSEINQIEAELTVKEALWLEMNEKLELI